VTKDKLVGNNLYHIPLNKRIAQGSLKQLIYVNKRVLQTTNVDSMEPTEGFTTLFTMMGRAEIVQPSTRMDGVEISGEKVTHLLYINYDPIIFQLDFNTTFIEIEYNYFQTDRNRRFKMLKSENYNDEGRFIVLYLHEQGFVDKIATEG
jgi:hypothetical protein